MAEQEQPQVIPRKGPELGLDGDIPKYWYAGDAFKSRFFDAMQLLFPEGEKFFISCVRDYRDRITDPELAQQVKDFIYQEGQHGMVHLKFSERLRQQGIAVDDILERQKRIMFGYFRKRYSSEFTLGQTCAGEHMTAIMAHGFFEDKTMFEGADPRVRAMYAWHAVEEIEHKAVAYDVMQKVAQASYFTRILSFMLTTFTFPFHVFLIMAHMFRIDGLRNKWSVWLKGLWWLYGPRGIYTRILPSYFAYFMPGFHPWKSGPMWSYHTWREAYDGSGGDALVAAEAVWREIHQPVQAAA